MRIAHPFHLSSQGTPQVLGGTFSFFVGDSMKKLFLKCLVRFRVWCYRACKIAVAFGLIIAILACSVPVAFAEVVSGSDYITEGDQPLTIGTGSGFARYVNDANYYMAYDISAVPPRDLITTKGLIGEYVPSTCTFFNLGFETSQDNVFFAFSNQNPIKPGEIVTFSCKVDCISGSNASTKLDLRKMNTFHFLVQFFYDDNYDERLQVSVNVNQVSGVAVCSLTFKNTTGRNLSLFNIKVDGSFSAGAFTGGNFRMYDLRYHIYTEDDKSTAAIEKILDAMFADLSSTIDDSSDEVSDAIEESTDKIINGWDGDGRSPSGGGVVGDLGSAEDELLADQSEGLEQSSEIFSSVGTQLKQFYPAFLAVSGFLDDVFNIPLFSFLITLSLALGIISLLLNLVPGIRSSVEAHRRRASAKASQKKGKGG